MSELTTDLDKYSTRVAVKVLRLLDAHGLGDLVRRYFRSDGRAVKIKPMCSVTGCKNELAAKGLCKTHWSRKQRGKPLEDPLEWRGQRARPAPVASIEFDPLETLEEERERLQRSGTIGNPLQLVRDFNDPERRQPKCPVYNGCITYVVKQGWKAFTCDGCVGPGPQPVRLGQGVRGQSKRFSR